ncbi:MAG TPA: hypothetical protein VER03_24925 [Bryobacteraceae bacterium]|nr:hypothetical protein [Bryobacteraceae bacterium]
MLLRFAMIAALAVPMFAFDDDDNRWERDRRYERNGRYDRDDRYNRNNRRNNGYGYGNTRGGYGSGNNSSAILNRTMQDLRSAASRNRVDSHERDHFNRAMSELQNMRYSQGNVDSRRLSRVLEDLDHLSNAHQIHPRDRQILARDRQALASLYGGYGYNRW